MIAPAVVLLGFGRFGPTARSQLATGHHPLGPRCPARQKVQAAVRPRGSNLLVRANARQPLAQKAEQLRSLVHIPVESKNYGTGESEPAVGSHLESTINHDMPDIISSLSRSRTFGKQPVKRLVFEAPKTDSFTWTCPLCDIGFEAETAPQMAALKSNHLRCRHIGIDRSLVRSRGKKDPVILSDQIPENQMAWKCPICKAGHSVLSVQDHKRAVKRHCKTVHPQETSNP